MEEHIIAQQIDVIVIEEKKHDLLKILLEREISEEKTKKNISGYTSALNRLMGGNIAKEQSGLIHETKGNLSMSKFSKMIVTKELWLHIHFFLHDNRILDPFISKVSRGNISICIIACDESTDLNELKHLFSNPDRIPTQIIKNGKDQSKFVKQETIYESKIFSKMHNMSVEGFTSVLTLKITPQNRIFEESSNLRLTPNQVLRWVVDRHFQNKYRIKIKQNLEDQIECFQESKTLIRCNLI